jgi:GNAT superfamily N-acetyltransferase
MDNELLIGTITYAQLVEEMHKAMGDHWQEVPFGNFELDLKLDDAAYLHAEAEGHLRIYVAYMGRYPIAYMAVLASGMLHHAGEMQAVTDSFYVVPEYRNGGIFGKLLAHIEEDIKELGIRFLTVSHNPQYKGNTPDLLEDAGYMVTEVAYTKEV